MIIFQQVLIMLFLSGTLFLEMLKYYPFLWTYLFGIEQLFTENLETLNSTFRILMRSWPFKMQ